MSKKLLPSIYSILLLIAVTSLYSCSTTKIHSKGGKNYIKDKRDGKKYEVAYLNGQWWMVEDFSLQTPQAIPYKNGKKPYLKLGLTYPFEEIQQAAPKGWRLPTEQELAGLFLQYGKVSYSGELSVYREKFGPYEPELSQETYKKLEQDKRLNLPIDSGDLQDWDSTYPQDFRTLFWSSDTVGNRVYAIYWNTSSGVHFSSYPKEFYGFCRFVKDEKVQQLDLKIDLPKAYHFNIRDEKDQHDGFRARSYEAVDPKTQVAPFEIIVTEADKSLMDLNGTAKGLEEHAKQYSPDIQLTLLKKEDTNNASRRLYQLTNKLSTVLMLLHQKGTIFSMVEVEFHPQDFQTVSLKKWQQIFWNIKNE